MEKLLRKIAWDYSKKSRIDFEELLAEANLAYCEALQTYDKSKGKITTHVYHNIQGRLLNFVKEERLQSHVCIDEIDIPRQSTPYFEKLSKEAQEIAEVVLTNPDKFVVMTKEDVKGRILAELVNKGFSFKKIWQGFEDLSIIYQ